MVRNAGREDCRQVYHLICEIEEKTLPYEPFAAIYQKQLESSAHAFLLEKQEGSVVGVLHLRLEEQLHHAAAVAEIMELAVDSAHRGKGLGKVLFAYGCQRAREAGCVQLEVACNQLRTGAHRFYQREGMRKFHFKFSKLLVGEDTGENRLGR